MLRYLFTLLIFSIASPIIPAQDTATLEYCQRLKDRAESYQERRRQGGSGPQMDAWKDRMRDYELQFRENDCQKYRRRLKS